MASSLSASFLKLKGYFPGLFIARINIPCFLYFLLKCVLNALSRDGTVVLWDLNRDSITGKLNDTRIIATTRVTCVDDMDIRART